MNELEQNIWLPPAASTLAKEVDPLYYFILWASTAFFAIVLIAIIYFVKKYRNENVREKLEKQVSHNSKLEFFWTAIPTILIIIVFFWGARSFLRMQIWPVDAIPIKVYANAWHFDFKYPYGNTEFKSDSLVVPAGNPVKLMMTAEESQPIHSLFIPDFRVKQDIMANRYSQLWFESEHVGTYDFYCTEYCGEKHSNMNGHVVVMPPEAEKYTDKNENNKYDYDEVFTDSNGNGKWDEGEDFIDIGNGAYNEGEPYLDCGTDNNCEVVDTDKTQGNGKRDKGESFTDIGDQTWTKAEAYIDANNNNKWDTGYDYWFKRKIAENERINDLAGAALGEKKYSELNCYTCHSNGTNSEDTGPSFVGLWEKTLAKYSGEKAEEDAVEYIRNSIRNPSDVIAPGYTDQMPKNYTSAKGVSNDHIDGIIEYIKTLK